MAEILNFIGEIHAGGARCRETILSGTEEPLLSAHNLQDVGWVDAGSDYCISEAKPEVAMLYACVEGRGEVMVGGQWQMCGPGMAYLTPKGAAKAYRTLPGGARWKNCWILAETNHHFPVSDVCLVSTNAATSLFRALRGLYGEHLRRTGKANGTDGTDEAVQMWLDLVLHYAHRIGQQSGEKPASLGPLWEQVMAEPARAWSLTVLARLSALSEESLRRRCLAETGVSPMKYVTRLRMKKAATLLVSRPYPLVDVAHQVGYENVFAFSTAFARIVGTPPAAFRRSHANNPWEPLLR